MPLNAIIQSTQADNLFPTCHLSYNKLKLVICFDPALNRVETQCKHVSYMSLVIQQTHADPLFRYCIAAVHDAFIVQSTQSNHLFLSIPQIYMPLLSYNQHKLIICFYPYHIF